MALFLGAFVFSSCDVVLGPPPLALSSSIAHKKKQKKTGSNNHQLIILFNPLPNVIDFHAFSCQRDSNEHCLFRRAEIFFPPTGSAG